MEGWGFVNLQPSINLWWVSGYGNLGWRRTTCGDGSSLGSMGRRGVGDIQNLFVVLMVVGCGRVLE